MKVIVDRKILNRFPKLNIGIVIAHQINNHDADKRIHHLLAQIEKLMQINFVPEDIAKHPLISPWMTAYTEFGAKPSRYHSSVESLAKKVLKGKMISRVNKIIDLYNYLSLKYLVPMGGDDLSKIKGDINLTFAKGTEKFTEVKTREKKNPEKAEVVYKDDEKILCRRWNWRECEESKITNKTEDVIIYVEGIFPVTNKKVKEICRETADLIKMFCGGKTKYYVLNDKRNEVKI